MSVFAEIDAVLENRLSTIPYDIAWPNFSYSASPTASFVRPNNLPIEPTYLGISDSDFVRRDGFYQVEAYSPKNTGRGTATDMADAISTLFAKGTELITTSGYKLKIMKVSRETGQQIGAHYVIPVLILYTVITP